MSTKASVASPKWSERKNSFFCSKVFFSKCELKIRYLNVSGSSLPRNRASDLGHLALRKLFLFRVSSAGSADASFVNNEKRVRGKLEDNCYKKAYQNATPYYRAFPEPLYPLTMLTMLTLPTRQIEIVGWRRSRRKLGDNCYKKAYQNATPYYRAFSEPLLPLNMLTMLTMLTILIVPTRQTMTETEVEMSILRTKAISQSRLTTTKLKTRILWLTKATYQSMLTKIKLKSRISLITTKLPAQIKLTSSGTTIMSNHYFESTLSSPSPAWAALTRLSNLTISITTIATMLFYLTWLNIIMLKPSSKKRSTALFIRKDKMNSYFTEERHLRKIIERRLIQANDVETNPGPRAEQPETKLTLLSQNCRGLSDEKKLKHLLNNSYNIMRSSSSAIIALQETMIINDQRLKFGWRGNHVFTPGTGHGRGCVTLLPTHVQPDNATITHFEQRGHIFKATLNENSAVIANIYSPNGHNREKIDFFKKVKEAIELLRDPRDDVYLLGDFNTVFEIYETHSRTYSTHEQRCSTQVKQIIDSLALEDIWLGDRTSHTWRQTGSRKSSRLDRIYFSHDLIKKNKATVDWAFTNSDHGALIATFTDGKIQKGMKPLRLNPELLNSSTTMNSFLHEYTSQLQQIPNHWNPHTALEFHKCAMRNAYLKVNSENKKRKTSEYDFLKEDLHAHIATLENTTDTARSNRLMNKINALKAKLTKLNLEKGAALANKLKTKWYNEGERSNKYFLSLLRKKERNGLLTELEIDNKTITDEAEIESQVTNFYRQLYNQKQEQVTERETTDLLRLLEPLTAEETNNIMKPLTLAALKQTLKETQDSCPGPDGIPYSYLKITWEWFGPALLRAWEHSLQTKTLTTSHKSSWLRLIPKPGKNIKDLKNWRPITLSNCDHKLITKAISKAMTENLGRVISGSQTAYLRSRSISDNLRVISLANKLAKKDDRLKGLLIALDAKKAFDSVNHQYIRDVLTKIGLQSLIPIFDLLYTDSKVDIMINNKLCQGYFIKNGVKQGDALSCTLFILAMEPLIRNLEANQDIETLKSQRYRVEFPKCIGYADDISILTTDQITCVRATMSEYEKFTKVSGLQLNADKTEIFSLSHSYSAKNYRFMYRGQDTTVTNLETIKINGLLLSTDPDATHKLNYDEVKRKMDKQFASWANRGLSLLGKILIYKTFALSQIIYSARVIKYTNKEHSELRNLIYKFLWNRNYQGAKAPDRIKRAILTRPIKDGGFGMVDHESVITAMNTRQIMVNLEGTHPIKNILNVIMIDQNSSFHSQMIESLDGPGDVYCTVMNRLNSRLLLLDQNYLLQDRIAKDMLLSEKLKNVTRPDRKQSLELVLLRNQGKITVRQLLSDPNMTNHFRLRLLHYSYSTLMDACILSPPQDPVIDRYVPIRGKYKLMKKVTSKEIRTELELELNDEELNFKLPTDKEHIEQILPKINKLKCVKAKNLALRIIHGDIFTGTKLLRFNMAPNDECSKCRESERLEHLLKDCWYSGIIWRRVKYLYIKTDQRRQNYEINGLNFVIGSKLSHPKFKLHLEIIRRLTQKDRPNILPKMLIRQSLDHLIICDKQHFSYYKRLRATLLETNT